LKKKTLSAATFIGRGKKKTAPPALPSQLSTHLTVWGRKHSITLGQCIRTAARTSGEDGVAKQKCAPVALRCSESWEPNPHRGQEGNICEAPRRGQQQHTHLVAWVQHLHEYDLVLCQHLLQVVEGIPGKEISTGLSDGPAGDDFAKEETKDAGRSVARGVATASSTPEVQDFVPGHEGEGVSLGDALSVRVRYHLQIRRYHRRDELRTQQRLRRGRRWPSRGRAEEEEADSVVH